MTQGRDTIDRIDRLLGGAAILLALIFVYLPSLRGGWVWDDVSEVVGNPTLRDGSGLAKIWFAPPGPDYLPLKSTVQWLEWHLFGGQTFGYHAVSLVAHAAAALLLWRLLARLGVHLAWLGGVLFAVHPVAVQSVAWISEQKNTLSLPLFLVSALAFLNWDRGLGGRRAYALSLAAFLAAMLCKASVVMLPVVLLLHAWWVRGRLGRRDAAAVLPFFARSGVLGWVTIWFQWSRAIGAEHIEIGGPLSRLAGAGMAICFYAGKCLFPAGLMPVYPGWAKALQPAQFIPWIGLAAAFTVLWSRRTTWGRPWLFGLGFFVITLVPVLGFLTMSFMRLSPVSDHFAYIPLIGLVGLAAAGAGWVRARLSERVRPLAAAAVGALLAVLMIESRGYAGIFRDGVSLWGAAAARNPLSAPVRYNLANALVLAGRPADALREFSEAVRLKPGFSEAHSNCGDLLRRLGRTREATDHYEEALRAEPGLILTRLKLGDVLLEQGELDRAIQEYATAAESQPNFAPAQASLAYALAKAGRLEESIGRYKSALQLDPSSAESWNELGTVFALLGDLPGAIQDCERAVRLNGADPEAHNNLGLVLARAGRLPEAIEHFEAALRLRPDFPIARANLDQARQALAEGAR